MKMLTDQELDSLTKDCIGESDDVIVANIGVYWDQIIAQAKLAYTIREKAADTANSPIYNLALLDNCEPVNAYSDRDRRIHQHGFYRGVTASAEAILAMEIPT